MGLMLTAFLIGAAFGATLFLSGLANPDKIVGTLRLKDLHALRVIVVFVLTGVVGVWILDLVGLVNWSVKPAAVVGALIGGALLGIGFGLTGYCPGTGLACAAAGRLDALATVIGMFLGALAFILTYRVIGAPLDEVMNYGKIMLPETTGVPRWVWVTGSVAAGVVVLVLTRRDPAVRPQEPEQG